MAHAPGDALDTPLYGAHYLVTFPVLDADGDLVTAPGGLDSEVSKDLGTFTDCTNEATEIATSSGMFGLYLTGAEMTAKVVAVIVKSTGGKTVPIVIHPKRLPVVHSGTAQAGAAGTITLASGASDKDDFYNGLFVYVDNNSPAGVQYQARRIVDYVGSTRVATIESNWGTNPSSASTYQILLPDTVGVGAWAGAVPSGPTSAGVPDVNVTAVAANALTASALATDAVNEIADGILLRNVSNTEGSAGVHTLTTIILAMLEHSISGTTMTIKRTDGTTTHTTRDLTLNVAAQPITGIT